MPLDNKHFTQSEVERILALAAEKEAAENKRGDLTSLSDIHSLMQRAGYSSGHLEDAIQTVLTERTTKTESSQQRKQRFRQFAIGIASLLFLGGGYKGYDYTFNQRINAKVTSEEGCIYANLSEDHCMDKAEGGYHDYIVYAKTESETYQLVIKVANIPDYSRDIFMFHTRSEKIEDATRKKVTTCYQVNHLNQLLDAGTSLSFPKNKVGHLNLTFLSPEDIEIITKKP